MTWKRWLLGLVGAVINGAATGGATIITALATGGTLTAIKWEQLGLTCLIMGLLGAFLYLKEHREVWTPAERAANLSGGVS